MILGFLAAVGAAFTLGAFAGASLALARVRGYETPRVLPVSARADVRRFQA
jgi:hypothetical protein